MKNQDIPKFALLMAKLSETYKEQLTEISSETFWNVLQKFELSDVGRAVNNYIADPDNKKTMPKPGDLVGWIIGLGENRALLAWSKVMNAIRRVGAYDSVIFDDTLIHAVIDAMGGWVTLCRMKNDEAPFVAKEFQKYYLAFLRDIPKQLPMQVYGIFPNSPPKLIGDARNSIQILTHQPNVQLADIGSENKVISEKNSPNEEIL